MMTFPTFKTLHNVSPKMAHKAAVTSAQKQICEVSQKGHTLMDSFDRVGAGAHRVSNLAQFASLGRTVGTKIDGASGRQGANAGTGPLGTGSNATTISRKDLAQFRGTSRAHVGIESAGAGLGSSKDMLGSLEPEAGLASGVENGTVDKQGNASNIPGFGADSRLMIDDLGTLGTGNTKGSGAPSPFKVSDAAAGFFACLTPLGCVGFLAVEGAKLVDHINEYEDKNAEKNKEEEKTETEANSKPAEKKDGCENPEDDRGGPQLSSDELQGLGNAGFNSLTQNSDLDVDSSSFANADDLSPENMSKKRRDTYSRPSGEDGTHAGGPIAGAKVGTAVDGLIQNFQNDIGGISPDTSGEGG